MFEIGLDSFTLEFILRLLVAVALGSIIGLERELNHKEAGLRTHVLVCLGACLFTIVSMQYFSADPARVAAGIVTGIGFLGAGSIIATKGHVKGLTTAASVWAVAAVGLTIGVGNYILSLFTAVLVLAVLKIGGIEKKVKKKIKKK